MHERFIKSFDRMIASEGGSQKMPEDKGNWTGGKVGVGELKGTKYGVSAASYPDLDIENLTIEQARDIFYSDWWEKLKMDQYRPGVAFQILDTAYHSGMYNAARMLQRAVGANPDGVVGPMTLGSLRAMDVDAFMLRFNAERLDFLTKTSAFKTWPAGMVARVSKTMRYAADDLEDYYA